MIIGRIIGWLLLALAAVLLGRAVIMWSSTDVWQPEALGALWYGIDRGSLNLVQAGVQRHLHPALWDPGIVTILQLPGWLVFAILGLLLVLLFRRRAPKRKRWFASR